MRNQPMRIETINSAMALRLPQYESLQVLDTIMRSFDVKESHEALMRRIHERYPIFREFERGFPSLTFALATGVGKTMLMGAFIAYLYTNYDIKNYFIVAPNLTIYNKLIQDFGDPAHKKYVFRRIQPFVQNPPTVITGDTYGQYVAGQRSIWESVTISIFNIGKINAEVRRGNAPQVKRLSEYIGTSYFEYLSRLPDLVVLMDESHHYRADRGMAVINELNPLLGLELTATPQVESGKGTVKFRNVVYEYSLARAIVDGYVKEPAAATRRAFDPSRYTADEIDRIKLIDGLRIHRNTVAELIAYAENEGKPRVKPFVLVVCKETAHAAEVKDFVMSPEFFDGYYADKVIEVHSAQSGSEKDENITQLVSLEDAGNRIEIVIHVNMLKEGWDVTNLYTIIPLRTATSQTLREQTIGRGLRLPFGTRTGNAAVDRLTLVSHDKFDELINAANEESSIIRRENIIDIEEDVDLGREKEVVRSKTRMDDLIEHEERRLSYARSDASKQAIQAGLDAAKAVGEAIEEVLARPVNLSIPLTAPTATDVAAWPPIVETKPVLITANDLHKPEVQAIIRETAKAKLESKHGAQVSLPLDDIDQRIESAIAPMVEQAVRFTIEIPNITVVSKGAQRMCYEDFDLDTRIGFAYKVPVGEILIESLQSNAFSLLTVEDSVVLPDSPENILVSQVLEEDPVIDYGETAELLYRLAGQAIAAIGKGKDMQGLHAIVQHYKRDITQELVRQIRLHRSLSQPEYEIKLLQSAAPILPQDLTKFREDDVVRYTADIPAHAIRMTVVGGYEKACHTTYKFDSVPEHIFSIVLERDEKVLKWMRPAPNQFKIWWQARRAYEPDFVVETADDIYIVEVKARTRAQDEEVALKAKAAQTYCEHVNRLYAGLGRKPWRYMLLIDSEIHRSVSFAHLERENDRYSVVPRIE